MNSLILCLSTPGYIGEGFIMQSGCDVCGSVCGSVCDSVCDNPRISGTSEARDFKFYKHAEGYGPLTTPLPKSPFSRVASLRVTPPMEVSFYACAGRNINITLTTPTSALEVFKMICVI